MSQPISTIAFIGLGRMGYPMTRNLLSAGYKVRVYDIVPERITALVRQGGVAARSPADAAQGADLAISMILDDTALLDVALGPEGVVRTVGPETIFADMSTVSPMASEQVGAVCVERAVHYLRAKVSGSIKPATEGSLTIFASGSKDAYDRCVPVFSALGKKMYYVGQGEEANYLKLVHSIMIGITAALVGEAFTFGERGGVDWKQMVEVINNSALGSVLFDYKVPLLNARDYSVPQSTVDVAAKDIDMALAAAKAEHVPMPVTALVRELYRTMQARGEGGLDFFGIVRLFEEMACIDSLGQGKPR